ncbi:MAG: YggT family protein [Propionibacteriaceae bacterium]|nr:YggT family protein [Propionibacteriaceae bacterium]
MLGVIIAYLFSAYLLILSLRALISFVPLLRRDWTPRGAVLVAVEFVYTLTDPPIKLLRRVVPPLRLGSLQFDLAFIVLWFAVVLLGRFLPALLS